MPSGSTVIGTTPEQAYDQDPWMYAYAQTGAATMNYVKSLEKKRAKRYWGKWLGTRAGMDRPADERRNHS